MTVAFDAIDNSGVEVDPTWVHTPVGTPRAAIVWIITGTGVTPTIPTYGGTTMAATPSSPVDKSTGETRSVHCYFLGASIPTGAQTVTTDTGTDNGSGYCITLTAAADTEVVDDFSISSDSIANPSDTLLLTGRTSFAAICFMSGIPQLNNITPLTNWTSQIEIDTGSSTQGCYSYDTIGTADVTAGWTQNADDAVAIAIAVSEVVAGGASLIAKRNPMAHMLVR